MEEFIVHRKKSVLLTALAAAVAFIGAAKNSSLPRVSGANTNASTGAEAGTAAGIFEGHGDVGTVLHEGSVEYDAAKRSYAIAGSGEIRERCVPIRVEENVR